MKACPSDKDTKKDWAMKEGQAHIQQSL